MFGQFFHMKNGGGEMKTLPVYANNEVTPYWRNFMDSLSKTDSEFIPCSPKGTTSTSVKPRSSGRGYKRVKAL